MTKKLVIALEFRLTEFRGPQTTWDFRKALSIAVSDASWIGVTGKDLCRKVSVKLSKERGLGSSWMMRAARIFLVNNPS